jgi:hypothetical protein
VEFKIDKAWFWNYKVYERTSFFGYRRWKCVKKTDFLFLAEDYIKDRQHPKVEEKFPRYYTIENEV